MYARLQLKTLQIQPQVLLIRSRPQNQEIVHQTLGILLRMEAVTSASTTRTIQKVGTKTNISRQLNCLILLNSVVIANSVAKFVI